MISLHNIFRISWKALLTNKTRSVLTTLGIIIGVMAVILLVSLGSGLQQQITQQFEDLGANLLFVMPGKFQFRDSREGGPPGVATNKLTLKESDLVEKKVANVTSALPIATANTTVAYRKEETSTFIIGTNEHYEEFRNSPVTSGRWFTSSDVAASRKVAVAGTTVIKNLFSDQNPIGQKVSISGKKYEIIGVLTSKGGGFGNDQDDQLIVPITAFQKQFDNDKLSYFYVKVADNASLKKVTADIKTVMSKKFKADEFSVVNSEEILSTFQTILGTITAALGGIAAISLLVGGIGIMNIMLVSVTKRTREIGLRKAIGATNRDILMQFLLEAVILTGVGGVIGILLGAGLSFAISLVIRNVFGLDWNFTFPLQAALLGIGVSSIIGLIFGLYPARTAAKKSPIEALRYE